jgi:hypothetical protein
MKKTNKVHPLIFFREKNEARNKSFSKSLPRADEGVSFKNTYAGPITESDSKRLDQQFPSTVNAPIPFAANKPNKGYGTEDQYRKIEKEDRSAFENYLKSPAVGYNNKRLGTGFNNESLWNQKYNREAQLKTMNKMNNIDWNSEEGKREKFLLDRDVKEGYKKGGTHKMPNGKVMLNSKMKKGGVIKSKKK